MKRTYKVTLNRSRKTATIRVYDNGKLSAKYRTGHLTADEMGAMEYYADGDTATYLKTSGNYYPVK